MEVTGPIEATLTTLSFTTLRGICSKKPFTEEGLVKVSQSMPPAEICSIRGAESFFYV
jgi:hypothetical protein